MSKTILGATAVGLSVALAMCPEDGSVQAEEHPLVVNLPQPRRDGGIPLERALDLRRSIREYSDEPLDLAQLSQLLWAAQGITSDRLGRTGPSAGALYPLELYVVAARVAELRPGVYRYRPGEHRLEKTADGARQSKLAAAALGQECVEEAAVVLVVAAVFERTTGKYGKRGSRYVDMEVGHAAQNVYLQATSLGLGTVIVGAFDDREVRRVLDLPRDEDVRALMPVGRRLARR